MFSIQYIGHPFFLFYNYFMSKKFLLIFFIFPQFVFARPGLSLEPYISISSGTLGEYLYSTNDDYQLVSYLDWQQEPLYNIGMKFNSVFGNFGISANADFGFPLRCGTMYDYDYFYNSIYPEGEACNRSLSEVTARLNFNSEVAFYFSFSVFDRISINPSVQIQYKYSSFEAKNGRGRYGRAPYSKSHVDVPWYSEDAKEVKLYGAQYDRHSFFTWMGLNLGFKLTEYLYFGAGISICPFAYTSAIDHHLAKPTSDFYVQAVHTDSLERIKYDFSVFVKLNQKCTLTTKLEFLKSLSKTKGNTMYGNYIEQYKPIDQKTATDINLSTFTCGINIEL